jgi:signal transduction histidine kinase
MDQRTRQWALLLALSAAFGTALVAATAVYVIRHVLRQDIDESAQAQRVIHLAKLHGLAEQLGGHARGFLLTADPEGLDRIASDRTAFFARLEHLLQSSDSEARSGLEEVRATAREYDEALDAVVGLRRSDRDTDTVVRAFEETARPRKEALDRSLSRLIDAEEARLESLDQSAGRAASRLATTATAVAGGALLVSIAMAVLLARTIRSLLRKRAEAEAATARVQQANADLDAFAGRVAHDLRTPLTPIIIMAQVLQRSTDQRVLLAAGRISRSAQAANRMLEALLAFSRLGQQADKATTVAAPVIREALEDFAENLAETGTAVVTDLDEEASVACGGPLLRQLVGNLVGNAIKFMAGREERRLRIDLRRQDGRCQLEVWDTGPGIPPEVLARVFDAYYRAPGVDAPGSGLGLAIVRRIVDAHGGTVTVTSTVGRGTTFRVSLPDGQRDAAADSKRVPQGAPEPAHAQV